MELVMELSGYKRRKRRQGRTSDRATLADVFAAKGYEGLIFKTLNIDAAYEPSRRSHNWLKLKRAYFEGLGDSLYLVPVAAYYGHGNQTGVYGTFVPACYDTNKEEFQSISKIGKGFSDALLEERSASLGSIVIPKPKKGSTLMYGLTQHRKQEFQHFDDFTLASSWERVSVGNGWQMV
ncbi:tRNA ligase [Orobanche gracilis]